MRLLPSALITAACALAAASALTPADVHLLEQSEVLGPVSRVIQDDTANETFPETEAQAVTKTSSYDAQGRLIRKQTQYYEGSADVRFDYVGKCLRRRRSETSGYSEVEKLISVYAPDARCRDSQIVRYEGGQVSGRTQVSRENGLMVERTYALNNAVTSTVTTECSADGSRCRSEEVEGKVAQTRSWTLWPGGKLRTLLSRTSIGMDIWFEEEGTYNAQGWLTTSVSREWRAAKGVVDSNPPSERRSTYTYLSKDRYGNWTRRVMLRVNTRYGKQALTPEMTTTRTLTYR